MNLAETLAPFTNALLEIAIVLIIIMVIGALVIFGIKLLFVGIKKLFM